MARTQSLHGRIRSPPAGARFRERHCNADPALVFDLGKSRGSDIARNKDAAIAEAFASTGTKKRRR
jgi:hypothetical protein